jgi:prepilin-type N-terminal cleavage/methylation domain-containing protein
MQNNQKKIAHTQSGFSLIELIIVMVFLGVVLVATMRMMTNSIASSVDVEFLRTAANLANEKMEQIFADKRSRGFSYIDEDNYPPETNPSGAQGFARSVEITTDASVKKVKVTISHISMPGFVLTAWLTKY